MMETQEVDYVPPDAFRKIDFDDVTRDRDNPVGYLHFQGREEPLYKEKTLLGRDSDSDIIIDSPQISRHHATFKVNQKQNAIFICVYGKNNYLNGEELDSELFYQVTDKSSLDFRSVKMSYRSNNNPEDIADDNSSAVDTKNSAENKENQKQSLNETSLADSTHEDAEANEEQEEEENTQFEEEFPAPSPEAEVPDIEEQENKEESSEKEDKERISEEEVVEENTLKIPFEDNPFLEDSQMNFAKPSGSGFKLRRLPSFESQEQLISEMETQPLDVPLNAPCAVKKVVASNNGKVADTSGNENLNGDSQMSLEHVELRVSLDETQPPIRIVIEDTQPINTITLDSQTQVQDHRESPKVRKSLSYEEPGKTSDIMVISSDDDEDEQAAPRPGPSRAADIATEPNVEISPVVMRRRKTATASDTLESPVGSPEQLASSTPQSELKTDITDGTGKEDTDNVPKVDETNVSEDESDGIVEASDEDEPTAKRFFVKDTQEVSAEGEILDTSDGIINETQEEDADAWQESVSSNNITAVEVHTKEKDEEANADANGQDKQEVINESLIGVDKEIEKQEATVSDKIIPVSADTIIPVTADKIIPVSADTINAVTTDKIIPVSADKTPFTSELKKKPKRISRLSLKRSTSPQKPIREPIASTSSEEKFVVETTIPQDSLKVVGDSEQSQDEQVGTPEIEESKDMPKNNTESSSASTRENFKEIPDAQDANVDTSEVTNKDEVSPIAHAAEIAEEAPSSDDESLKKVDLSFSPPVNMETPKAKKTLPISRERSPDPDISIAEEVKMSPRLSKIAAAEKLESPKTTPRAKLLKSAIKSKTDIRKQPEPENSLEPNFEKQGRTKSTVPADKASGSTEPKKSAFLKPKKQTTKKMIPRAESSSDKGSESETETKVRGRGRPRAVPVIEETAHKIAEEKVARKRSAQVAAKSAEEPKAGEPLAKSPKKGKKDDEKQTGKTAEPSTVSRRQGRKAPESNEEVNLANAAPRKRNAKTAKTIEPANTEVSLEPPAKSPRKSSSSKDKPPVESDESVPESSAPTQNKDEPAQPESEGRPKRRRTLARKVQEAMESAQRETPKRKAAVKGAATKEVTPSVGANSASKVTKAKAPNRSTRQKQTAEDEEKTEKGGEETMTSSPDEEQKQVRRVRQSRAQKAPAQAEPQTSRGKKGKTATKKEDVASPSISTLKKDRASRKDSFAQNAPKRGRQSTSKTSSSFNSSDSQSRTRTKTYVFFSGFEGSLEKEVKLITKLGGVHKDDVPDKKHKGEEFILVVNGSFKRTLKVIDIIGHGAPIVSENWLRACEKADTFVDAWDYILQDKAAEKKFGFNLRECLTKANQKHDVFASWSIYFTPNVKPSGAHLKKSVEALGGKYLATKPRSWPANNLMVVTCEDDQENYRTMMKSTKNKKDVPFVSVQGLFECMQQQKIVPLDKFMLI